MKDDTLKPTKRARIRLVPPEPEIELYKDGFGNDALGRERAGQELSNLLDMVEGRLVVAVDGKWGSGKTHFLKCWSGAYERATVVYFDAFAHDHVSQPLPAMVSVMRNRFKETGDAGWKEHGLDLLKSAHMLTRPVIRALLAAQGAGAVMDVAEAVAAAMDDRDGSGNGNFGQDEFWKDEAERLAAMDDFRKALAGVVAKDDGTQPLVIIVDELDRCRPDYALETLEVIKHLFAVDGVHFVLGVNLDALEHIVRAMYGRDFPARKYLNRFIQVVFNLPEEANVQGEREALQVFHLRHLREAMNLNVPEDAFRMLEEHLGLVSSVNDVSLRDVGDIMSRVTLAFRTMHERDEMRIDANHFSMEMRVMLTLIVSQVVRPDLHARFLARTATREDLKSYIGERELMKADDLLEFPPPKESEHSLLFHGWDAVCGINPAGTPEKQFRRAHFGSMEALGDVPGRIRERFLARFVPYEPEAG